MNYDNYPCWTNWDTQGTLGVGRAVISGNTSLRADENKLVMYRAEGVPARKQNMKINRNEEVSMHQIISDYAATKAAISVYEEFGMDVPGNLKETLKAQRIEIERRVEDALRAKLAAAEARLEAIKTAEEKRSGLREEIAALKAKLAKKGE